MNNIKSLIISSFRRFSTINKQIDFSKVPVLNEKDLIEQQVRGSGPGGQKINKTSSCVVLKHIPTGLVVKCQETRYLEQNRKIARSLLVTKLDNLLNGDDSIEAQKKRYSSKKRSAYESKKEKLKQLKKAWKERENIK
ncbi:mitochondrial translation release factor in rescue-like [Rhynchophorus ferrugineus]|uniref:mitochondrial translation release factor in rescue-like n=1 Tax=Rhynchophorus ferrugineus TaxID=354439 RepID=UPI003FCC948F